MARGCLATEGGWKCCPLTLPAAAVPGPQVFARFVMKKGWSSLAHAGSFEAKYVPPSQTELDAELARLSSTSGTVTSLTYQLAEEVKELERGNSLGFCQLLDPLPGERMEIAGFSYFLPLLATCSSIIEGTQLPKKTFQLDPTIAATAAAADNPFLSTAPIRTIAEEAEEAEEAEQASTSDQVKKSPPESRPASALGHAGRPSAISTTASTLSRGQSGNLQSPTPPRSRHNPQNDVRPRSFNGVFKFIICNCSIGGQHSREKGQKRESLLKVHWLCSSCKAQNNFVTNYVLVHMKRTSPSWTCKPHTYSGCCVLMAMLQRKLPGLNVQSKVVFDIQSDQPRHRKVHTQANTIDGSTLPGDPQENELAARAARQVAKLPLSSHPLDPPRPMTFSPGALRALSLGLAAQGGLLQLFRALSLGLAAEGGPWKWALISLLRVFNPNAKACSFIENCLILVLDHNQLGDLGAQILSTGINRHVCAVSDNAAVDLQISRLLIHLSQHGANSKPIASSKVAGCAKCGTLKQLSLENCGIGPEGALALGGTMVPHDDPKIYDMQPK
eukprot:1151750-Pelagomonas_calceolata.AAC.3